MTKVLLVEDHEELWDVLSRRLRRHGFEVVLAHDGQHALDQVSTEEPDIILLDMDLKAGAHRKAQTDGPGMNAFAQVSTMASQ